MNLCTTHWGFKSSIYITNVSGPSHVPWGMPAVISIQSENVLELLLWLAFTAAHSSFGEAWVILLYCFEWISWMVRLILSARISASSVWPFLRSRHRFINIDFTRGVTYGGSRGPIVTYLTGIHSLISLWISLKKYHTAAEYQNKPDVYSNHTRQSCTSDNEYCVRANPTI